MKTKYRIAIISGAIVSFVTGLKDPLMGLYIAVLAGLMKGIFDELSNCNMDTKEMGYIWAGGLIGLIATSILQY